MWYSIYTHSHRPSRTGKKNLEGLNENKLGGQMQPEWRITPVIIGKWTVHYKI